MSLRNLYETDPELERSGIEYHVGSAVFRIARTGGANVRYNKKLEQLCRPYRKQIQSNTLDRDTLTRLGQEAFAHTVLLNWDGVTFDDLGDEGNTELAPFSPDNAMKLFANLPDLFDDLQEAANERALFRAHLDDSDAGNS